MIGVIRFVVYKGILLNIWEIELCWECFILNFKKFCGLIFFNEFCYLLILKSKNVIKDV